ncbi:hypothetical protein CBR_g22083 [Chara braunii]|uniref:Reverse transcriptase/retrotransposon-derived protein RNase H-like domain-containing protein n=1 Tax=Chara braunii TaxID=69332 RepID=A0A388L1Y5_CHABU|nr:hypothetical protein CBR_g22083 [Chara braunii]|eukprot:GBG76336.1 hypothetical protein CBR_g22083 [Chara braunii]
MDELVQCSDHGLTPEQILNHFAMELSDALQSQLYAKTKEEDMTCGKAETSVVKPQIPLDPLEAELLAQEEKLCLQAKAVETLKAELKKKEEAAQKEARRKLLSADVEKIRGCTIFSKIDLKSSYHQIEMAEGDVHKTAFKTRKFIKDFSAIAAPLTDLTKKDTSFLWTSECQEAFTRLKEALIRAPVLKLPNPTLPFVLTTDASQYGVGAVLQQDDGNGLQPIEYMSKKIKTKKLQDSTYKKELYALVPALKHWKHFLLGKHFKIFSDHSTLQWMKSQGELNDKLARYIQFIDMFDFELRHKKGCYNRVADALSRRLDALFLISTHSFGERTRQTIAQLLPQDEIFGPIVRNLQDNPASEPGYTLVSGLLYTCSRGDERMCIPQDRKLRTLLMSECHDAQGHFGALKSYAAPSQRFFLKETRSDMLHYVETCELCQRNKVVHRPPLGLLKPLPILDAPAQSVSIDFTDLGRTTPRGSELAATPPAKWQADTALDGPY